MLSKRINRLSVFEGGKITEIKADILDSRFTIYDWGMWCIFVVFEG